ncbi:MAG TPA: amino acid transporter, partial [Arthrobacter sp.]|nr:amino acid transporter [Arthrobacter sp.]
DGTVLPLRMKGFPGLTIFGLMLLALIFAVGFSSPESSKQLVSTIILVAGIAAACWIGARLTRNRGTAPAEQVEHADAGK